MSPFYIFYLIWQLSYRSLSHGLLANYVRKQKIPTDPLSNDPKKYPSISILVPIKGPVEDLKENLASIYHQNYPGKLELIIAIRDPSDPVIAEGKQILEDFKEKTRSYGTGEIQVKWIVGGEPRGMNPKNSNLYQAFTQATHDWIYCSDADTKPHRDHLREVMDISKADPMNYVTSITIHDGPRNLGASLEVLGTNVEATGFFLVAFLSPKCGVLNGASGFFHKSLLEKIGGFDRVVNAVTDDLFLGKLFSKAGAKAYLAKHFVRVTQEHQTLRGFRERQVRWLMIAKYFRKDLFWPAPSGWIGQFTVVYGLIAAQHFYLCLGITLMILRIFECLFIEIITNTPKRDWLNAWAIVIYDIVMPFVWIQSVFRNRVAWGGKSFRVKSGGLLEQVS